MGARAAELKRQRRRDRDEQVERTVDEEECHREPEPAPPPKRHRRHRQPPRRVLKNSRAPQSMMYRSAFLLPPTAVAPTFSASCSQLVSENQGGGGRVLQHALCWPGLGMNKQPVGPEQAKLLIQVGPDHEPPPHPVHAGGEERRPQIT